MKNTMVFLIIVMVALLGLVGFIAYKALTPFSSPPVVAEPTPATLPTVDASIKVEASLSKTKNNTVVLAVSGLAGKMANVDYELSYVSGGIEKGVTSGSKPIDVSGQDSFEREVYLGTCSRNVCKPDLGVNKVSVVLAFTDTSGKKSQFSQDYQL